jgi:tripartite-type tricarboxylate transporter receptor subunit TctC
MRFYRREVLQWAASMAGVAALPRIASALDYPARPVHILVGFPPGGTTDMAARIIGDALAGRLGQTFVTDNRPGASTNIATEAAAHAAPDGYTLLAAVATNTINPALNPSGNFNFLRDLAMVAGIVRSPLVLQVNPSLPVNSVAELIAYVKANPGKLSLASFGTGSLSHVTGELFKTMAGIEMLHVPYRGSAPMITDLMGGQVMVAFDNLPASVEQIKAGKLRALAVTTAARSPALPDVPVLGETLPGFDVSSWVALAAPKKTPAEILDKLNKEANAALADPKTVTRLADVGGAPYPTTAAALDTMVAQETERWAKVVREAGIKAE